jgi:hypothetical protein
VPESTLLARVRCLATIVIGSASACAQRPPPEPAPAYDFAQDRGGVVHPNGSDCRRVEKTLGVDESHPYGESVQHTLRQAPAYRCVLRLEQGQELEAEVTLAEPSNVKFHEASCTGSSCNLCFSELTFEGVLRIRSAHPELQRTGRASVRQLAANDGYAYEVRSETARLTGSYGGQGASLTVYDLSGDSERVWARTEQPCVQAPGSAREDSQAAP